MRNRNTITKVVGVLLLVVFLGAGNVLASQPDKEKKTAAAATTQDSPVVPELTDIIPLSAALSGALANLENKLNEVEDFYAVEKTSAAIAVAIGEYTQKYNQLKERDNYSIAELYALKQAVADKKYLLATVSNPLKEQIKEIDSWKTQWQIEKKRWIAWQSSLLHEQAPEQLKLAFKRAHEKIDTALDLVMRHLETMLVLQAKSGEVMGRTEAFDADLIDEIADVRQEHLFSKASPLFSSAYLAQFTSELWASIINDFRLYSWSGVRFFMEHRWIALLELCFVLGILSVIHGNREALSTSKHWKFLTQRPVSSALFINILTVALLVVYTPYSDALKLTNVIFGGIASMRVLGLVLVRAWRKQAVYWLMAAHIISEILASIGLPSPLVRLYIFSVSLIALYLLKRWIKQSAGDNEAAFHIWLLQIAQAFFAVVVITELWGNHGIAAYLFQAMIGSLASVLPYMLFIYMIYGGLDWLFHSSPIWRVKLLRSDVDSLVRSIGLFFVFAIIYLLLVPVTLVTWDMYDNVLEAARSINLFGFSIGSLRISLGVIVIAAAIFYCAFLTSRILPKVLLDEAVIHRKLARGVQRSITQLIQYCIIFVGFLLALSSLGFEFSQLTIILSAFGVGIGFGLQGIVNNFFCGLILLFERPLTEGDTIEMGTKRAHIKKIGLRSTIVTTLDQADLIIPNADLINNQVTNWTLTNREVRLCVPVGVAYGSDIALVLETLLGCAKEQEEVVKSPAPQVLFMALGESSLNFELRVWIHDVDRRRQVTSALYIAIEGKFRDLGIGIPFPQRDIHFPDYDGAGSLPGGLKTAASGGE